MINITDEFTTATAKIIAQLDHKMKERKRVQGTGHAVARIKHSYT